MGREDQGRATREAPCAGVALSDSSGNLLPAGATHGVRATPLYPRALKVSEPLFIVFTCFPTCTPLESHRWESEQISVNS